MPAPGSDADVQEAAAILLALRLGDRSLAENSALQLAIQQQVPCCVFPASLKLPDSIDRYTKDPL